MDSAIAEKRITGDKKEHFVNIGKMAGIDALRETLSLMRPARKPTEVIHQTDTLRDDEPKTYAKLSDVPAEQMEKLRDERRSTPACTKPNTALKSRTSNH